MGLAFAFGGTNNLKDTDMKMLKQIASRSNGALAGTIALALLVAPVSTARAEDGKYDDGNYLMGECDQSASIGRRMYCLGYIRGIWAGVSHYYHNVRNEHTCEPANVTLDQMRAVTMAYLRRNPARRSDSSLVVMSNAIIAAWPCI